MYQPKAAVYFRSVAASSFSFITRPRMGPSLGFVTDVLCVCVCVCVWSCVTYYGLFYCTIGFVLRHCLSLQHCFWILFEFQMIRKGCIFTRPRIANRRRLGTSQPLELYCTIGDYFSRYDLSFK